MFIFLAQLLLISLVGGITGGMFGFSTGAVIVPSMVMLMGLDQRLATGTFIAAQILPVGLLGASVYYRTNNINISYALLLAFGMTAGNLIGALLMNQTVISDELARKLSGAFLLLLATRYLDLGIWGNAIASLPLLDLVWSKYGKHRTTQTGLLASQVTVNGLSSDFILRCERELTKLIGPVASILVQTTLQTSPQLSPVELVMTLVDKIPNPQAAFAFQQRLIDSAIMANLIFRKHKESE